MDTEQKRCAWRRIYHSGWGRVVLSAAIAAIVLSLFSAIQQITYLTNDDNAIAFTLAGYHTGEPVPYALFINCLMGYLVSALYTAAPAVPWWAVLQIASIAFAMTIIGACMLSVGAKRELPLLIPLALYGALLALLFAQPVVELTYTVTAAILGAAGVALVLCAADAASLKRRQTLDVLGALLTVGAFLYREETGFALLCFFAAACAYRALLSATAKRRAAVKAEESEPSAQEAEQVDVGETGVSARGHRGEQCRMCALFLITLAVCLGALLFNNLMQRAYHGGEYRTFFAWRERFTDYPRDSFADNPELYRAAGWDETVYDLADHWCFMDARINAEAFKSITEGSTAEGITLTQAAAHCIEVVDGDVALRMICAYGLCTILFALHTFWRDRSQLPRLAAMIAILIGTAALCLFLGLRGRFLARTFQVVAIPGCVALTLLVLQAASFDHQRFARVGLIALACAAGVLAAASGLLQAKELRANSPRRLLEENRAVMEYVLEHPENVYIRDTYVVTDVDAITTYPKQKPTNLLSWGGCEMRSATAERQLAVNGLTSRYADVFGRENVRFITRTGSDEEAAMDRYLRYAYGGASLALVETITGEIAVYRAVFRSACTADSCG